MNFCIDLPRRRDSLRSKSQAKGAIRNETEEAQKRRAAGFVPGKVRPDGIGADDDAADGQKDFDQSLVA
jgi:hypothetical protein